MKVQTNKMQDDNNATAVKGAEAAAAAEMAVIAGNTDDPVPVVPKPVEGKPVDLATDHPNEDANMWKSLTDEFEEPEGKVVPEVVEPPPEVVVPVEDIVPPVEVPPEEPKPAAVEGEIPGVEPPKDTAPTNDVVIPVTAPPKEMRSAEEVTTAMNKAREDARVSLVDSFKLTETQVEEFREDPNNILPQLAADLYLDIYNNIMTSVQQNIPGMMTGLMQRETAAKAHEQAFYNAWPQLAKGEYTETINRITQNYAALNPTADAEMAIKEIGAQAWVTLRLPLDQLQEHTQATSVPVQQAAAVEVPAGRVPANAGSTTMAAKAPVSPVLNSYETLAEEFINDDEL